MEYTLGWDTGGTNSVIWGKINGVYIGMGHSGANTVGRGTIEYTLGRGTGGTNSLIWGKANGVYLGMGHWGYKFSNLRQSQWSIPWDGTLGVQIQ